MTEPFSVSDRRAMNRTASGIYVGNPDAEMRRLRQANYVLPNSNVQARIEAKRVAETVSRGSLADVTNRATMSEMRKNAGGMGRTAANTQMALPKVRQPLSSLMDKGIPFNVQDPKELTELRRWCNSPQAPVWMGDYSFKPMGEIAVGDQVIGWDTYEGVWGSGRRELTKTTVLAVNRRIAPEVVRITFASGRTVECTPDHEWLRYYAPGADGRILNGPEKSQTARHASDYAPLQVGSIARSVVVPTEPLADTEKVKAASWLAGIIDGEGSVSKRTVRIVQSLKRNPDICARIDATLDLLGITHRRREVKRNDAARGTGVYGGDMIVWDFQRGGQQTGAARKNRQQIVNLLNWAKPTKFDIEWLDNSLLSKNFGEPDEVVSIKSLGPGEVISMQTSTGNYTAWGFASKNCRLFYSTHDLVPLLIDIYSKFPVVGLEFSSKDPKIEKFYEQMFMDDLNYSEFLPDGLGREYFMVGEVTSLAHFNESLGIWSSEEILNPDMVKVSKSLFVEQERVQLLVKELVEDLRSGPSGMPESDESPSERLERNFEYQQLVKHYPEVVKAAAQDDGLDMSDALVSRMVNKASWWDLRGTPHLLRSFRTLMMEESLNAAQDAVADRLYAPLILATMGIPDMGDGGGAWIPDQGQLDDLRDDMQSALAADFKLMVHNFGVNVTSVFGRESVPRFDTDYDRVDAKLLQAWGIGQALIAGGTSGGGAYASSALNREVCEQLMLSFQNKVKRHMRKRMEVIAEAQEHYDFELKGGVREPIYREIVQYNEETDEEEIVRVPKLLIPEIKFETLNLRDESTERAFISQLKQLGVPISDDTLAVNIQVDFEQELERQAEETVSKGLAQAQAMAKLQTMCDAEDLPYPAELAQHLQMTLQLRQMLAQTQEVEDQAKMMKQQIAQASPAGMMGLLPGTMAQPPQGGEDPQAAGDDGGAPQPQQPQQDPAALEMQTLQAADQDIEQAAQALIPGQQQPQQIAAAMHGPRARGPYAAPPGGVPDPQDAEAKPELPRNRTRPVESDEQRAQMPKEATAGERWSDRIHGGKSKFEAGPSSYGQSKRADENRVKRAVRRREALARGVRVEDLVHDPDFYATLNAGQYESQIQADWPEIQAGGGGESRKLLEEMLQQYEEVTGISPQW